VIEYTVVTKKGIEYVYADSCNLFPTSYVSAPMAQFYRKKEGKKISYQCHTSYNVISVTPNIACSGRLEESPSN
jgi:hypothetical protein